MSVRFTRKLDTALLIHRCAKRAARDLKVDRLSTEMDLSATHASGQRMRFEKLLTADAFDFAHDIFGIARHLDRETGRLQGCFLPRCSEARS